MTIQTNANVNVFIARETTPGTIAATNASAYRLRIIGSKGSALKRAIVNSMELRDDGFNGMGRLGVKSVDSDYDVELTPGGANDLLLESITRSTWATLTSIGFATMTTIAIGTNTLTAAGGDFVGSQGIRVGDVFTLSGTTVAGNNNTRHIVTAIGSMTIVTTTGAFTTLAATATGTLTIGRKLVSATTPTRYSHTIEQFEDDITQSERFLGMRIIGLDMSYKPGQMAKFKYTFQGMNRSFASAQYFSAPTATTNTPLVADDSSIRYNGSPITTFTGLDLSMKIGSTIVQTIGSTTPADVIDNICTISGTITGLRSDLSDLTLFDAETEFELMLLLQQATGAPPDFLSVYLPRIKLISAEAPVGGDTGAKIATLGFTVAPKVAATGYNGTPFSICSSGG